MTAFIRAAEKEVIPVWDTPQDDPHHFWQTASRGESLQLKLLLSTNEAPWTGEREVTGRSELEMIYPDWLAWANLGGAAVGTIGAAALLVAAVLPWQGIFLPATIATAVGVGIFAVGVRMASRMRNGTG